MCTCAISQTSLKALGDRSRPSLGHTPLNFRERRVPKGLVIFDAYVGLPRPVRNMLERTHFFRQPYMLWLE